MDLEKFVPDAEECDRLIDQALDEGFEAAKGRLPSSSDERRAWLRDENGAQVLNSVPPVAFAARILPGVDLDDPESFLSPSVQLSPVVNPLFHALMVKLGAEPNGVRSYEISARKAKSASEQAEIVKRLKAVLEVVPGSVCYAPNCVEQGEQKGFHSWNISRYKVFRDIYCLIHDTSAGEEIDRATLANLTNEHPTRELIEAALARGEDVSRQLPLRGAAVVVSSAKGRVFLKVCTNRADGSGLFLSDEPGTPDLDRLRPGGRLDPQVVTPDRALTLMDTASSEGYSVLDPEGHLDLLRRVMDKMVVGQRVSGAPGQSRLVVGMGVDSPLGDATSLLPDSDGSLRVATLPAAAAGDAVRLASEHGYVATLDPAVADVIAMAGAEPVAPDDPDSELTLRDYQREAVGLHLSTSVGYLQACSVGLGKTAITLRGMRGHAESAVSGS